MRRRALTVAAGAAAIALVSSPAEAGLWQDALGYVLAQQQALHRELSDGLSALRDQGSLAAAWALVVTSFLYGVFHAAGPGHGKVVLTAYLVSHERRIGRAMALSALSALLQGLVAIALVLGLVWIAGLAGRDAQGAAAWAERASFLLVAALGGWLAWRAIRPGHGHHDHGHDDHAHHGHHGHDHGYGHDHGHDHGGGTACGHAHVVTPEAAARARDLRTAAAVVVSVGLRPCSGAVLVLAVANILHMAWAGVLSVLVMSAGTAITVCALALFAVFASDRAARLAGMRGHALALAGRAVAAVGGLVILAFGLGLLWASFGPAHPLGLGASY